MENFPAPNTVSIISFLKQFYLFVLAMLGLGCYVGFSLVLESRGYSLVAGLGRLGLLTVVPSLAA